MASLSFKLSAEDTAVFKTLQDNALLPTLAQPGEGELVELFKQRKREEQKKQMEPYADYLEHELEKYINRRKDAILAQLKSCTGTAFTAELCSWKTVNYYEPIWQLQRRVSAMKVPEWQEHSAKMRERQATIEANKWETTFGVEFSRVYGYDDEDETDWVKTPVKVDRIFRHSDLATRLSLKLGPNFFPFIGWEKVEGAAEDGQHGYTVFKKTLYVRYYPFGVNKQQMDKLLKVAKSQAKRMENGEVIGLCGGEYAVGHEDMHIVPPAPPAPVPLLGAGGRVLKAYSLGGGEVLWRCESNQEAPAPSLGPAPAGCFCGCADE